MTEPLGVVASWATPTSLFVLLNIVIGFIAFSSVFNSRKNEHPPEQNQNHQIHHQEPPQRLLRAPSLFSRVTSFNFSGNSYESAPPPENQPLITPVPSFLSRMTSFNSLYLHRSVESETTPTDESEEIVQAPSLLARMTSFNRFSLNKSAESEIKSETTPTDEAASQPQSEEIVRAPSLLARMTSFNRFSVNKSAESEINPPQSELDTARAPSLLSRMSSIDFSLHRSTEPASESAPAEEREQHVTVPKKKKKKKPPAGNKLQKSSNENIEGKEMETASFGKGEVDAQADDFINRFKQQLRLQRLDSLLRYRNSAGGS